jgi:polyisoprenoid-binding protein YceI
MNTNVQTPTSNASSVAAVAVGPSAPTRAAENRLVTWDIDTSHANAGFKVRHLMVSHVRGHLGPVSGTVVIDERDLSRSSVDVSVDVRGIDTREPKRDEHLRSADFFDAVNYPSVTFRSTRVDAPEGLDGDLRVTGDLTMHGVSRPITLEVETLPPVIRDPWGNARRGVTAHARISRKEWGLVWNLALEAGGIAVGDEVTIEIEAEIVARKG